MSTMTESLATVAVTVGEQEMTFETGKLAKQADGAVVVRAGETMVLATAQGKMEGREGADFFPLTVDVEERMYAAGKIPGGFFKREGRPTERAILTARMIDRPIRPLWPKGYKNEVHVVCTTLSADLVTAHDILCINGASAALMVSPLPFLGPVGAVRIGRVDGELVINPTLPVVEEESTLDLIVVGTKDALTMIEAGADEIPEEEILEAFELAHGEIVKICDAQEELRAQAGKPKYLDPELTAELESEHGGRIRERIEAEGLREAGAVVEELTSELAPRARHGLGRGGHPAPDPGPRLAGRDPREDAPRGRRAATSASSSRTICSALTEAEQDSKELKSAKRQLLFDRIIESVELPFPVGPATVEGEAPVVKDSLTKQYVKKAAESIYKQLVRRRSPSTSAAPTGAAPRTSARSPARSASHRGRTAPPSSRAARRRSCRCSRSARRRRASGSTTSRSRPIAATCTTTTSRPTRSARPASCAARSAATSATARSRSGRSSR